MNAALSQGLRDKGSRPEAGAVAGARSMALVHVTFRPGLLDFADDLELINAAELQRLFAIGRMTFCGGGAQLPGFPPAIVIYGRLRWRRSEIRAWLNGLERRAVGEVDPPEALSGPTRLGRGGRRAGSAAHGFDQLSESRSTQPAGAGADRRSGRRPGIVP